MWDSCIHGVTTFNKVHSFRWRAWHPSDKMMGRVMGHFVGSKECWVWCWGIPKQKPEGSCSGSELWSGPGLLHCHQTCATQMGRGKVWGEGLEHLCLGMVYDRREYGPQDDQARSTERCWDAPLAGSWSADVFQYPAAWWARLLCWGTGFQRWG